MRDTAADRSHADDRCGRGSQRISFAKEGERARREHGERHDLRGAETEVHTTIRVASQRLQKETSSRVDREPREERGPVSPSLPKPRVGKDGGEDAQRGFI